MRRSVTGRPWTSSSSSARACAMASRYAQSILPLHRRRRHCQGRHPCHRRCHHPGGDPMAVTTAERAFLGRAITTATAADSLAAAVPASRQHNHGSPCPYNHWPLAPDPQPAIDEAASQKLLCWQRRHRLAGQACWEHANLTRRCAGDRAADDGQGLLPSRHRLP